MKYTLLVLLGLINSIASPAQKNNLYADAGICLAYLDPGASVTYNYNFNKHISIGAGLQEYTFHTTVTNLHQLTPAVFGEFRYNMRQRKKGRYFLFFDLGIDLYNQNNSYYRDGDFTYTVPNNNGVYAGSGIGYMHYTTRRHGGPYVSLKMVSNWYTSERYNQLTNEQQAGGSGDGTFVVSVGFKF
jgi:hypothetical protein